MYLPIAPIPQSLSNSLCFGVISTNSGRPLVVSSTTRSMGGSLGTRVISTMVLVDQLSECNTWFPPPTHLNLSCWCWPLTAARTISGGLSPTHSVWGGDLPPHRGTLLGGVRGRLHVSSQKTHYRRSSAGKVLLSLGEVSELHCQLYSSLSLAVPQNDRSGCHLFARLGQGR